MSLGKFETVTLADVSINNKGEYGIGASAVDYSDELYTYLRITDINDDGTLNKNDLKSVDDDDAKNYLLNENDVVFARTGNSTGKAYYYDKMDGELVYAGFLIKFSLDPSKINPKFMKYYVLSEEYKGWVNSMCTGSTRPNINAKMYGNMELILPPREQQDFLVNILDKIDKKIEINKRINKNLEEQLSLIFDDNFVKCNAYDEESLVKTDWGKIPKEWKNIDFGDIIQITSGDRPEEKSETKTSEFNIPLFGASKIMGYTKEFSYNEDILIIGRVGTHGVIQRVNYPCFPSDNTFVIKSRYYGFVYQLLKRIDYDSLNTGSTQPLITQKSLKTVNVVLPDEQTLSNFENTSKIIFDEIYNNQKEIATLTKLRDTLLPKLMSGEIDVSRINCDLKNIIKTFIKKFKCILLKYYHERKIISKISLITLKFLFIFLLRFIKSSILSNIIAIFF